MLWKRILIQANRLGCRVYTSECPDPIDLLTGLAKKEFLAHLAGDCDPFRILAIKRGRGTRECPNLIPSAFDKRLIGCICHPDVNGGNFMWLHKGEPKRCECGHWFELYQVAPFV